MTSTSIGYNPENNTKFLESLQADLKTLSSETKKKYPQIKEVSCHLLFITFSVFNCRYVL